MLLYPVEKGYPMNRQDSCDTKVFYDTEFQATVMAARASARWGEEMMAYKCGSHWHMAHVDTRLRGKHIGKPKRDYCEVCQQVINPRNYAKHILKARHLSLEAKEKALE